MEGGAGHEREAGAVVLYGQDEGFHLFGGHGGLAAPQDRVRVVRYQVQHEAERGGRMRAFDQAEAERAHGFPQRKVIGADRLVLPLFGGIELSVLASVDVKGVVGADDGFLQQERVEIPIFQKFFHELSDVRYFQCDHDPILPCSFGSAFTNTVYHILSGKYSVPAYFSVPLFTKQSPHAIISGNENHIGWLWRLYELQNRGGQLLRIAGAV